MIVLSRQPAGKNAPKVKGEFDRCGTSAAFTGLVFVSLSSVGKNGPAQPSCLRSRVGSSGAVAGPRSSTLAAHSSHATRSPRPLPSLCWRRSSRPPLPLRVTGLSFLVSLRRGWADLWCRSMVPDTN